MREVPNRGHQINYLSIERGGGGDDSSQEGLVSKLNGACRSERALKWGKCFLAWG